jgi:uncharacterized membrane protein SpoIIM required for sporulation
MKVVILVIIVFMFAVITMNIQSKINMEIKQLTNETSPTLLAYYQTNGSFMQQKLFTNNKLIEVSKNPSFLNSFRMLGLEATLLFK